MIRKSPGKRRYGIGEFGSGDDDKPDVTAEFF